jgi:CubicO group peptidase (beta-lactamase class C family)
VIPTGLFAALLLVAPAQSPDSLDAFIRAQKAMRKIPGRSLAIVDHGKVVYAKGYVVTTPGGAMAVSTETRFPAGSISRASRRWARSSSWSGNPPPRCRCQRRTHDVEGAR